MVNLDKSELKKGDSSTSYSVVTRSGPMNDFDSAILNLKNKLGHKAPEKTYSFVSHAEAINHLQKIIQERLSIGYEIVSVEKENQVPILKEISASDRKQQSENEKILKLIGEIEVDTMNSISHSKRETNNLSEISVNQLENLRKRPPASISQLLECRPNGGSHSVNVLSISGSKQSAKGSTKEVEQSPMLSQSIIKVMFNSKSKTKDQNIMLSEVLSTAQKIDNTHEDNQKIEQTPSEQYFITCDSNQVSTHKSIQRESPHEQEIERIPEYEFSPLDDLEQEDINEIYDRHSHSNVLFDGLSIPDEENDEAAQAIADYDIDIEQRRKIIDYSIIFSKNLGTTR